MKHGTGLLLLLLLASPSCNEPDHPARLTCPPESAPCGPIDSPPLGGYVPGNDAGGLGDAALPDGGTSVSGRVGVLPESFEPTQAAELGEPARVQIEGEGGMRVEASVVSGRYDVSGVRIGAPVWAAVIPDDFTDLITTLQPLDTTGFVRDGGAVTSDLFVVRPSALELVLNVLTAPVERAPGLAHAVLRFLDENGAPVAGVTLPALAGETVAYDTGAGWIDDGLGTGPRGIAVLANVTALAYPGSDHPRALGGSARGDLRVRLAADAVSYQSVVLASGP